MTQPVAVAVAEAALCLFVADPKLSLADAGRNLRVGDALLGEPDHALRELLDVQYVEFARPRLPLVETLGPEHQSLPVLILAPGRKLKSGAPKPETAKGRWFFGNERSVREYLSIQYGFPQAS